MKSKLGIALSGIYLAAAAYFIATQGLFGESFVGLLLGLPWVLVPAYFEFGSDSPIVGYILILLPIAINATALYWVGYLVGRSFSKERSS